MGRKRVKETPDGKPKVLIFIDGPAAYGMQQELEIAFNYERVRELLLGDGRELVEARYYQKMPLSDKALNFQKYLERVGFTVINTDKPREDVDLLLANDISIYSGNAGVIILMGGDGPAYYEPLAQVAKDGKTIEIFCPTTMLNADFRQITNAILDPSDYEEQIIDRSKTKRDKERRALAPRPFQSPANGSLQPGSVPTPQTIGVLMALGTSVSVETLPGEILIRVKIPN